MSGVMLPSSRMVSMPDEAVEVIDQDGASLGFISDADRRFLGIPVHAIDQIQRYIDDPTIIYHATLLYERGLLTDGRDLNALQITLLAGHIIRRRRFEREQAEMEFERQLSMHDPEINPGMYKRYRQYKEIEEIREEESREIQWKAPESVEEFMGMLQDLEDEDEDGIASFLSEEELAQLSDDDGKGPWN
jgi:hypothetical protein